MPLLSQNDWHDMMAVDEIHIANDSQKMINVQAIVATYQNILWKTRYPYRRPTVKYTQILYAI